MESIVAFLEMGEPESSDGSRLLNLIRRFAFSLNLFGNDSQRPKIESHFAVRITLFPILVQSFGFTDCFSSLIWAIFDDLIIAGSVLLHLDALLLIDEVPNLLSLFFYSYTILNL